LAKAGEQAFNLDDPAATLMARSRLLTTTRDGDVLVLTPDLQVLGRHVLGIPLLACETLENQAVCSNTRGELIVLQSTDFW
jgi:hypothetical protein